MNTIHTHHFNMNPEQILIELRTVENWFTSLGEGFTGFDLLEANTSKLAGLLTHLDEQLIKQACDAEAKAQEVYDDEHAIKVKHYMQIYNTTKSRAEANYECREFQKILTRAKNTHKQLNRMYSTWKKLLYRMETRLKNLREDLTNERIKEAMDRKYPVQ